MQYGIMLLGSWIIVMSVLFLSLLLSNTKCKNCCKGLLEFDIIKLNEKIPKNVRNNNTFKEEFGFDLTDHLNNFTYYSLHDELLYLIYNHLFEYIDDFNKIMPYNTMLVLACGPTERKLRLEFFNTHGRTKSSIIAEFVCNLNNRKYISKIKDKITEDRSS